MILDDVLTLWNTTQAKKLTPLQEQILRYAWEGFTYHAMAETLHYQDSYIKNLASQLWQDLSILAEDSITKNNFRIKLKSCWQDFQQQFPQSSLKKAILAKELLEFPAGPVPLNSHLYLERPPIEDVAYQEIQHPGSAISLRGPSKIGKSSLLTRILQQGAVLGYATVSIDFQSADLEHFQRFDKLWHWLCANISQQVNLPSRLAEYWQQDIGTKVNATLYLQEYVLPQLNRPLLIGFNEINRLIEYSSLAADFLSLLRFWHEKSKQVPLWQRLRLVIVHSTAYPLLDTGYPSQFNVGMPLELPPFTSEQVRELALRHELEWKGEFGLKQAQLLWKAVGGHPYLVRLALYHLYHSQRSLADILAEATKPTGIYRNHLQGYLMDLHDYPHLTNTLYRVVTQIEPVRLDAIAAAQLERMGLVKLEGDTARLCCELYRPFFQKHLGLSNREPLSVISYQSSVMSERGIMTH